MRMTHQVADQAFVIGNRFRSLPVAHASRLRDRGIVAHVVDDPDKPVIQDRIDLVEMILHPRRRRAQR